MSSYTWLVGASLAATGSILSNLGVNCQKYSFMQNAKLPKAEQKRHIRQKGWLFGMLLVVLGSIGDFAALSLAAQSIVAPIGSITLVANVFFAHYWLKEHIGWVEIAGTSMIVLGSVTAVAFGDHSDTAYDIHAILRFFYGTTFIVYAVLSAALGIALYRFQLPITPIKQKIVDATKRYELAYDANDRAQMEYEDFYIASLTKSYIRWEKVHPFSICALSGILGGQSVMFGKMVSEMINVTASGDNQLLSPLFYLFIGCMLACVVGQLQYLAIALSFFDALYVVPVFQCFFIAFSTLGGASFFSEFSAFSAVQAVMFPLGLLTTLGGVVVLTRRKMAGPGDRLKHLVGEEEGEEQRASDEMSPIEEEDEAALREEEDDALTSTTDSTARGENEVLKMEQRRLKKERRKRRRLKKAGYEGLGDEDEDSALGLSESDTESEEEEKEEEEVDEEDVDFVRKFTIAPIIPIGDARKPPPDEVKLDQPHASPTRQSPIRRVPQTPPSAGPVGTPPSESSRRTITPLPNIDDLMGSGPGSATSAAAPTPAVDRRGSLRKPITVERRSSLERRASLPRRPSRSPGPLVISDDGTPPSSAPSTPSSLQRLPSLFMSGGAGSPAAGSLMQPSLSQYMPPPTGMDLWTKGEPVNDKVKKYSSVAHHAGGLVGVPIVSAIAHAYAIAREEREEEKAEAKQRESERKEEEQKHAAATPGDGSDPALSLHDSDDGGSAVEMEVLHQLHPTTPVMSAVTLPVAEAVVLPTSPGEGGGYAGHHHAHQGSIYGRLKGRLMHAMGGKGSAQMETAALTEEGGDAGGEDGKAEGKDPAETVESGEAAALAEERSGVEADRTREAGGGGGAGESEPLNKPSVDDTGPSDAEHEELHPHDSEHTGATEPPGL